MTKRKQLETLIFSHMWNINLRNLDNQISDEVDDIIRDRLRVNYDYQLLDNLFNYLTQEYYVNE